MQEVEKSKIQEEYIPVDRGDEPVEWIPVDRGDEPVEWIPVSYGRKKMEIIEKPLPPENIMTEEDINKLSKVEISEKEENYVPIYRED